MIDTKGRVDAWTGKNDIQAAGHIVGKNYSVQANLMLNDKVGRRCQQHLKTRRATLLSACSPLSTRRKPPAVIFAESNRQL
jgi:uncharacterized Ntn-hydrolase superfamily protein